MLCSVGSSILRAKYARPSRHATALKIANAGTFQNLLRLATRDPNPHQTHCGAACLARVIQKPLAIGRQPDFVYRWARRDCLGTVAADLLLINLPRSRAVRYKRHGFAVGCPSKRSVHGIIVREAVLGFQRGLAGVEHRGPDIYLSPVPQKTNLAKANSGFIRAGSAHSAFLNPTQSIGNVASYAVNATPAGSVFVLFGTGLATKSASALSTPLPTTLLATKVTVNGEKAPLFYVDTGQIDAQMPWDIPGGTVASVVVTNGDATGNAAAVFVPATGTPGISVTAPIARLWLIRTGA